MFTAYVKVRSLPGIRAQGALLQWEWRGWGSVGSYPRTAPGRPAIADKVRSYGGTMPHGEL